MTRRKKVEGTVRDHLVALRLTEVEYETVCDLAKEAGMQVYFYKRFAHMRYPISTISGRPHRIHPKTVLLPL